MVDISYDTKAQEKITISYVEYNRICKERKFLIESLIEIKNFGYENSGCGYTCAKKIESILRKIKEH